MASTLKTAIPPLLDLEDLGLIALCIEDEEDSRKFYEIHRPPVMSEFNGVFSYIYKRPDRIPDLGFPILQKEIAYEVLDGDIKNVPALPEQLVAFDRRLPDLASSAMSDLRDLASSYVNANWHIVLLDPRTKKSTHAGWNKPATIDNPSGYTQDVEKITEHLARGGNLGLATLPSCVASFDIDDLPKTMASFKEAGFESELVTLLNDPQHLHILSGREGRDKVLFRVPDDFALATINRSAKGGFEFRFGSRGGVTTQDVLPPSIHPDTGRPYQWQGSVENIQPLPHWLQLMWEGFARGKGSGKEDTQGGQNRNAHEVLTPFEIETLRHALKHISSEDYDLWVKIGLALKNSLGDAGFGIWEEWSKFTTAGNFDENECSKKWRQSFEGEVDNPITLRSIYHEAIQQGWSNAIFVESLCQGILEKIENGTRNDVLADDFIERLNFCQKENQGIWEREITEVLARKGLKTSVVNLMKALGKKRANAREDNPNRDLNEPIMTEVDGELPIIRLTPAQTHEVLRYGLQVLAATKQFFRQGAAICKLQKTSAKTEIVTFSKPAELRPELLNHAVWLKSSNSGSWHHSEPDQQFAGELLALINKSPLKEIGPIARQPFYRPDMTLCNTPGYDEVTFVFGDFDPAKFSIPECPTRADALSAAEELRRLFGESGLENKFDHSAALALLLTAAVRPALPTAPFFLLNAKDPGAGKKYLGDIACQFISPEPPLPLILKKDQHEVSKAIFSALIKGQSSLIFDEVMAEADGTLDLPKPLLTIATAAVYQDRVLGSSQMAECSTRVLGLIMGNNLRPTQDSVRRLIQINFAGHDIIDGVKTYSRDPLQDVSTHRERYVGLALTIIQAWVHAGRPRSGLASLPSYSAWCHFVREPLIWLDNPDPAHTTLAGQQQDDHILNLQDLFDAWLARHGTTPVTAGQLIRGTTVTSDGADDDPIYLAIKELVPHRKDEDISQPLGYLLKKSVGRIVGGLILRKLERSPQGKSKGGNRYYVEKIARKDSANADFYAEEIL